MYWRDPRKSGAVLGGSLTVLLSLAYCSVISVLATSLLLLLAGSFLYRTYKYVLQAVHKTSDGAPYQALMELDLNVDVEEVKRLVEMGVPILNKNLARLRSIFLIEDIVDSVKMALVLWIMTYIGAWFNGLTLVILSVASVFSIPKVYETYKTEIDTCLNLAIAQVKETYTK
ncbi:RTN1 [Cordylochernes scorpioides]|uniref:Reticulon-like protein n=1 Tax=Cordylochernes scorpioides TaxID=51811 RepID=A0ABY6KRK8_9ARAC|nr:RTN1 [Cordylochernes scorpioides]